MWCIGGKKHVNRPLNATSAVLRCYNTAKPLIQIAHALAKGRKLLSGEGSVVYNELTGFIGVFQKHRKSLFHSPGARIQERVTNGWFHFRLGGNPPLKLDHFGPGEKSNHTLTHFLQTLTDGSFARCVNAEVIAHLFAFPLNRRGEQSAFVTELIVDCDLRNARVRRHLLDRCRGKSVLEEQLRGGIKYGLAFGLIGWTPGLFFQGDGTCVVEGG